MDDNLKEINDLITMAKVQNFIKSNEIPFEINGKEYKCIKPSFKDRQEVYEKRRDKFLELKNEKDSNGNRKYSLEEVLIKEYKDMGVDIGELDNQFKSLESKINNFQEKIGKGLEDKSITDQELNNYREEIKNLLSQQREISIKKSGLLEYSLERQVGYYIFSYMSFISTYKKEGENWVRAWNTYEEMMEDEEVLSEALINSSLVFSSEKGAF